MASRREGDGPIFGRGVPGSGLRKPAKAKGRKLPATRIAYPRSYVAIDTETTGSTMECIEVGFSAMEDGEEVAVFETLLRPEELPLSPFIENLTGITTAMVETAPDPWEVLPELLDFLGGKPLVGHNVSFDKRVLDRLLRRHGFEPLENPFVDTLRIARCVEPDLPDHKLGTVFAHEDAIAPLRPWFSGRAHRALQDARMSAYVLETMGLRIDRKRLEPLD